MLKIQKFPIHYAKVSITCGMPSDEREAFAASTISISPSSDIAESSIAYFAIAIPASICSLAALMLILIAAIDSTITVPPFKFAAHFHCNSVLPL